MSKFTKYLVAFAAILSAGMTWAEGETTAVAKIGSTEYTDLHKAFTDLGKNATATAAYELTLLADVEISTGLTLTDNNKFDDSRIPVSGRVEWFQINLNNHKITLNGEGYVLTLAGTCGTSSMMIKNGTLKATGSAYGALKADSAALLHTDNLTLTSDNDDHYTVDMGEKSITGLLKNSVVTNAGKGGAVSYTGRQGFIHSSKITCEQGIAVYAELSNERYGGLAIAGTDESTVIKGETAVCVGENSVQVSYIAGGTIDGQLVDDAGMLVVFGGTYTISPEDYLSEGYSIQGEGPYMIHDESALSIDGEVGTKTVLAAFDLGTTACTKTITLQSDVYLVAIQKKTNLITINKNQNLTIDLNGHTLNCFDLSASYDGVHLCSVAGGGTLTITDSKVDSGNPDEQTSMLSFGSWAPDPRKSPGYANNLFTVTGTLNYDRGILYTSSFDYGCYSAATYCVDTSSGSNAKVNFTGGEWTSGNTCIRLFNGGADCRLTMTGGRIYGGNTAIWQQGGNSKADISGGALTGLAPFAGVDEWNSGVIYCTGTPGANAKITISGDTEITGNISVWSSYAVPNVEITGGKFLGNGYRIWHYQNCDGYAQYAPKRIVVSGGEFSKDYMYLWNYMKFYGPYVDRYMTVDQSEKTLIVNEDENYSFGTPVAEIKARYARQGNTIYDCDEDVTFDYYSSLPLALKYIGTTQTCFNGKYNFIAQNIELLADDDGSAMPRVYSNAFSPYTELKLNETNVALNGHKVSSSTTAPLVTIEDSYFGYPAVIKIKGTGSITSGGVLFRSDDSFAAYGYPPESWVEIYDGDYTTNGTDLFSGEVYVMADVGDGSYFDVNPASFSHDVSDFVYNKDNNITFKTINANDARYYLGRVVEVQDAPAK